MPKETSTVRDTLTCGSTFQTKSPTPLKTVVIQSYKHSYLASSRPRRGAASGVKLKLHDDSVEILEPTTNHCLNNGNTEINSTLTLPLVAPEKVVVVVVVMFETGEHR